MLKIKFLPVAIALGGVFSLSAQAGMVTDAHGNVGYDTAAECDAAVQSGTAKLYQSFTTKPALRRAGETSVRTAKLSDLGPQYARGACDLGAGRSGGRDGVSSALQGKYVPYSPNMPVNVYFNKDGQPVRATMKQCDNNFSGPSPRPVPAPVAAAPVVAAPVVATPVVAAAAPALGLRPYVFGTLGALNDKAINNDTDFSDSDTAFAGQLGAGLQFNKWLGGELFYQGAGKHNFSDDGSSEDVRNQTWGARLTAGGNVMDKMRLFAKAGVASVKHKADGYSDRQTRPTAGLGMTYDLTKNLALRADYDYYFKRGSGNHPDWKGANYLGLGLQYNF